jgi:Cu/Ag efflux protein CusF
MRPWKVVVLVNLALLLGVGWGWVRWGRHAERLTRDLEEARAAAATGGEREWRVLGVVRAVVPEIDVVVLSHEDIPGYMPAMTMGFRTASAAVHEAVAVGDEVRFTLRGTPPDLAITAIEKVR